MEAGCRWVREYTEEKSRIESDGQYIWGSGIRTVVETTTDFSELVSEYVIFERNGAIVELPGC